VLVSHPEVKGRPPGQESGPDANAVITDIRIPGRPTITLDDLPLTIRARTIIDPVSGCWRCCGGYLDPDGYAQFRGRMAHRVVWEHLVGEIPPGHVLDHVQRRGCRWRDCIWIQHLEPVTIAVNNMRSNSASAVNMRKTRCGACGAEYDLLNTIWTGNRRRCRNCETRRAGTRAHLSRAA
jgi:HNH endonuclease